MLKRTLITILLFTIICGTLPLAGMPLIVSADDADILEVFNNASSYLDLQQFAETHPDNLFIGILQETYDALSPSGKQAVWQSLVGKQYNDIKQLQYDIYTEVHSVHKNENRPGGNNGSGGGGGTGGSYTYYPAQGGYNFEDIGSGGWFESDVIPNTTVSGTIYFEETFDKDITVWVHLGHGYYITSVPLLKGEQSVRYKFEVINGISDTFVSAIPDASTTGYVGTWYCLDGTAVREIGIDGSGNPIDDADIYVKKQRRISGNFYLPDDFWDSVDDDGGKITVQIYSQTCTPPHYTLLNHYRTLTKYENETVVSFDFPLISDFGENEFIIGYNIDINDTDYIGQSDISPYGYYKLNGDTGLDLDNSIKLPATSYKNHHEKKL